MDELVVADGRVYTRGQIDAALARHAEHVHSWKYRTVMNPFIRILDAILG